MSSKYVKKKKGKNYVTKTDRRGNTHTFTREEYKSGHGHKVTGPDGRVYYERSQNTFRSKKLKRLQS